MRRAASFRTFMKGARNTVLSGVFSDEADFAQGTYVRNPPGSRHARSLATAA
jgi:hypothetical protein